MLRSKKPFPKNIDIEVCSYLKKIWEDGWLDDYSNDHFLIMAIENRLDKFSWEKQFLNNNNNSYYSTISNDGVIKYESFSINFCMNFSNRLNGMANMFGEQKTKKFIIDQLSAGKENYNEDIFFQALSEIEILTFFHRGFNWTEIKYEPSIGKNGANPEAYFVGEICSNNSSSPLTVKANIEVKTPKFPCLQSRKEKFIIPTVLLSQTGISKLSKLCEENNVEMVLPRVNKLIDFINSASKKFCFPKTNEYNLLYINWSYSDFPSNAFLEAWNLLTNEYNGLLTHPEIASMLSLKEPISLDAYKKITAIIVYTSSIDQLMFSDFRHVWQRNRWGCKFRMYVLDEQLRDDIVNKNYDLFFQLTSMNPSELDKSVVMLNCNSKSPCEIIHNNVFGAKAVNLILENVLHENK